MRAVGLCATLLVLSGCGGCEDDAEGQGDPWAFAGDAGDDVEGDPDAMADFGLPPDGDAGLARPDMQPRVCVPRWEELPGFVTTEIVRPVVISNDQWFFLQLNETGSFELWSKADIDAEPEFITGRVQSILDGGSRGVLYLADGQLILLEPSGDRVEIANVDFLPESSRAPWESQAYRMVDDEVIAWPNAGVWVATDVGVAQLSDETSRLPYVRNGYTAFPGEQYLTVFRAGRRYELSESNAQNVAMSNDALWFRRNGGGMRSQPIEGLAMANPQPVHPGATTSCSHAAVSESGETVLVQCSGADTGDTLMRIRGDSSETAVVLTGPTTAFATGDEWVAYKEEFRNPPAIAVTRGLWEPPTELGDVGGPCLSCGAFWAPNLLVLEGTKLAWNYVWSDEQPGPGSGGLAVAELCP